MISPLARRNLVVKAGTGGAPAGACDGGGRKNAIEKQDRQKSKKSYN